MTHIFPSSFHQRTCLYILVAISAEIIMGIDSSIFRHECELVLAQRHAVFCEKRRSNLQRVCTEKLLVVLGLALGIGKAGSSRGSRSP